ncbi:hypothetical protein SUGI_0950020 [Cryptomeria japonica]|nr:hypothetical protein SUGI_0950020 [Cryptomeria japonica]
MGPPANQIISFRMQIALDKKEISHPHGGQELGPYRYARPSLPPPRAYRPAVPIEGKRYIEEEVVKHRHRNHMANYVEHGSKLMEPKHAGRHTEEAVSYKHRSHHARHHH